VTPREHRHRRAENLRRPRTVMAAAFLMALFDWASRHADDDNIQIVIPTGIVTTAELSRAVIALISAKT
jgi:hypothetical protein